jgi:hypothetical protein
MGRIRNLWILAAALACVSTGASARDYFTHTDWNLLKGNMYVTAAWGQMYIVRPDSTVAHVTTPSFSDQQMPLAVITTGMLPIVRTTTLYNASANGGYGGDYDLSGAYIGGQYPQTAPPDGAYNDGTSDGTSYNYEIDGANHEGVQRVIRSNADWSNAAVLFNVPVPSTGGVFHGITYDPSNGGSLWLATDNVNNGGLLEHIDLSGNIISTSPLLQPNSPNWPHMIREYSPSYSEDYGPVSMNWPCALMRDPGTGYLWTESIYDGMGWFAGYDSSGNCVGALSWDSNSGPVNWYGINVYGGEIALPEPATLALLGVGAAAMAMYRWRRAVGQICQH